ncbi:unnamed protein product [Cercopithifilaria johnstoni]|uniref:Secreted protein n=1 Tax=Cercopithifilaria johnstoni TaxID=2874296 RepID=A0A8J2PX66_9BILA|nr:unnamed protein product [Cercopithifilaria johnstoni]
MMLTLQMLGMMTTSGFLLLLSHHTPLKPSCHTHRENGWVKIGSEEEEAEEADATTAGMVLILANSIAKIASIYKQQNYRVLLLIFAKSV